MLRRQTRSQNILQTYINMHKAQFKKGYSLVEMLIYVGILSIISIVIVNMLLSFTQTYRVVTALRMAEHSGIDAMDRMTRDIRAASTVDPAISKFGIANGELYLTATANGVSTTTDFYLENNIVKV